MFNEDEKFDFKIRSVLENGREEVPDRVWDSICERLDADRKVAAPAPDTGRKQRVVWVRFAVPAAAAAAIALAVIFSGPSGSVSQVSGTGEDAVAVVEPSVTEKAADRIQEHADAITSTSTLIAQADDKDIFIPEPKAEDETVGTHEITEGTPAPDTQERPDTGTEDIEDSGTENAAEADSQPEDSVKENTQAESGTVSGKPADTAPSYSAGDSFPDFGQDDTGDRRHKVKTSITLSGNAVSNSNAERRISREMMAPSAVSESGIREKTESNDRYGIPVSFGAGVRLTFTPKWSMSIGLNYTMLSRTFDGMYVNAETVPVQTTEYDNIRNVQHYIGIPIDFYYTIVHKDFIDFYTYAGGAAEYCLVDKYTSDSPRGQIPAASLSYVEDNGSMQFSANFGIGVEFILTDHLGIYIDPSLRYYFRNSNAPKSIRTVQPLMLGFEAGLRIRL